jgi:ankyrin repeat protein
VASSAILDALFTLNDDAETFVKPAENAPLRALAARHPPLDVYEAAAIGDVDRLRTLLSGDPTLANALHPKLGIGPLHIAAFGGSTAAVALLLASGATLDLTSRNKFHNTPLLLSLLADQYDTASALLAKGANVEATEEGSVRPIHLAAELGDAKMIALLLDHHATLDAKTDDGKTALDIATERGHREAAGVLRARGAR